MNRHPHPMRLLLTLPLLLLPACTNGQADCDSARATEDAFFQEAANDLEAGNPDRFDVMMRGWAQAVLTRAECFDAATIGKARDVAGRSS